MARNIRVSAVTPQHLIYNGSRDFKALVENYANYLEDNISQVLCEKNDLIMLPEVCDRYAGMSRDVQTEYYDTRGDYILNRMQKLAAKGNTNIGYSAIIVDKDGLKRNRTTFIDRNGNIAGYYDKNFLVWEEHTSSKIAFGEDPTLINLDFAKVGGVICYDLNFDELRQKYVALKPELLVFSSMYHGGYLARHWAYTNRCFFLGCIPNGYYSYLINPLGEVILEGNPLNRTITADINLDYVLIHYDYNVPLGKVQRMKEKYGPDVVVETPYGLGCCMITSKRPDVSALEMAREFDMELLDELFARSRKQRLDYKNGLID